MQKQKIINMEYNSITGVSYNTVDVDILEKQINKPMTSYKEKFVKQVNSCLKIFNSRYIKKVK